MRPCRAPRRCPPAPAIQQVRWLGMPPPALRSHGGAEQEPASEHVPQAVAASLSEAAARAHYRPASPAAGGAAFRRRWNGASSGLTRDDRRVLLVGQFRAVADLGATSDGLLNDAPRSWPLCSVAAPRAAAGRQAQCSCNAAATLGGGEQGGMPRRPRKATWRVARPKQQRGPSVCRGC